MDPRQPDQPEEFELDDDEPSRPATPRLPQALFKDPFSDDETASAGYGERFAQSLGVDDDDLRPPRMSGAPVGAVGTALPLRERLTRAVQRLGESEGERSKTDLAGVDVSAPSLFERLRGRGKPVPTSAPQLGAPEALTLDDPFARLLTPLAGPQLSQLQREVMEDDVLFLRYERSRQASLERQGMGLVFALVMLTLFLVFAGRGYLDRALVEAQVPQLLVDRLGEDNAGAVVFILGLVLPFLSLGALADTFSYTLRALQDRSLLDLCLAILSACFSVAILILLVNALPVQAAATLAAWFVFRLLIGFVRR